MKLFEVRHQVCSRIDMLRDVSEGNGCDKKFLKKLNKNLARTLENVGIDSHVEPLEIIRPEGSCTNPDCPHEAALEANA